MALDSRCATTWGLKPSREAIARQARGFDIVSTTSQKDTRGCNKLWECEAAQTLGLSERRNTGRRPNDRLLLNNWDFDLQDTAPGNPANVLRPRRPGPHLPDGLRPLML
jgi:hypothetical protein